MKMSARQINPDQSNGIVDSAIWIIGYSMNYMMQIAERVETAN